MIRYIVAVLMTFAVTGCVTYSPTLPKNYSGPQAQLDDSSTAHSEVKIDFFVVDEIDGARVDNSLNETLRRNRGRGMSMTPFYVGRRVIAEKLLKVGVKGRTHYAAPILALTGTVYQVKGVIEFTPKADGRYIVRGDFGDEYSAVWIEDVATNQPIGQKVEVKGSAKLGLFEK